MCQESRLYNLDIKRSDFRKIFKYESKIVFEYLILLFRNLIYNTDFPFRHLMNIFYKNNNVHQYCVSGYFR